MRTLNWDSLSLLWVVLGGISWEAIASCMTHVGTNVLTRWQTRRDSFEGTLGSVSGGDNCQCVDTWDMAEGEAGELSGKFQPTAPGKGGEKCFGVGWWRLLGESAGMKSVVLVQAKEGNEGVDGHQSRAWQRLAGSKC